MDIFPDSEKYEKHSGYNNCTLIFINHVKD